MSTVAPHIDKIIIPVDVIDYVSHIKKFDIREIIDFLISIVPHYFFSEQKISPEIAHDLYSILTDHVKPDPAEDI